MAMATGRTITSATSRARYASMTIPTRSARSRRHARAYGPGLAGRRGSGRCDPCSAATIGARPTLGGADPGVDEAIRHVDEKIGDHVGRRGEQDHALYHRVVLRDDRVDRELPDPLPREDRLDDHAAGEEAAELETDDRHHWDERVAHRVTEKHAARREPLRVRRPHVLAPEHVEERRAREPRDEARALVAEDEGRKDEPVEAARAGRGNEAERDREQQDQQDREEEARDRDAAEREEHDQALDRG